MTMDKKIYNDEQAILGLRSLYEQYGFKKYKMNRFEEYELYAENKSFLQSESIITFNDLNGKLLALNPDVTLSIVKNAVENSVKNVKVYYNENVCRVNASTHEIKDRMQLGLEHIGVIDMYATSEAIMMAIKSLQLISKDYILDISHLGFVSGLMSALSIDEQYKDELLGYISNKDAHDITLLCNRLDIEQDMISRLVELSSLYGSFEETFDKAKTLVINDEMSAAADELEKIYDTLKCMGCADKINIDFSIVNDMNYYNGVIFQGYVEGVPCYVLSGGRYDRLLDKMGKKDTGAVGFAVSFDLLEMYDNNLDEYDVDTVISYDDLSDVKAVFETAAKVVGEGMSVSVLNSDYDKIKCRKMINMCGKEGK